MADVLLCDLILLKADRAAGCSITTLALREQAVLSDLLRLLPRLACLQFGELAARVVPDTQGYRLRLLLQPRQRSLLVAPGHSRQTLEDEAQMLREDIQQVGLRVLRAVHELKRRQSRSTPTERNSLVELLVRRARQQWRFVVEHQLIELPFPDCPRDFVDEARHRVDGIVHAITERVLVVRGVQIWSEGSNPRLVAHMARLSVEAAQPPGLGCSPTLHEVRCGRPWRHQVRLKRCCVTGAVVGAIEVLGDE